MKLQLPALILWISKHIKEKPGFENNKQGNRIQIP